MNNHRSLITFLYRLAAMLLVGLFACGGSEALAAAAKVQKRAPSAAKTRASAKRAPAKVQPVKPGTRVPARKNQAAPTRPMKSIGGGISIPVSGAKPQAPRTTLTIVSKVRANVFDGGIFVGVSNTPIPLDPGPHDIMVTAEGYEDAKKSLSLKDGQKLSINVNLQKPKPPPPPVQRAAPSAQARPGVALSARPPETIYESSKKPALDYSAELPGPKGGAAQQARRAQPSRPQAAPQRDAGKDFLNQLKSGAPSQPQPVYQAPQAQPYVAPQQPAYGAPAAPQYPPTYAQPAYPYPQPYQPYPQPYQPQYAQPYAPYPPQYPAPYAQPYPQPPVYQAPAPAPAPAPARRAVPAEEEEEEEVYEPSARKPNYASPAAGGAPASRRVSKRGSRSSFVALLPFGFGQFQNGQHLKGTVFALGQVAGIGGAIWFSIQIKARNAMLTDLTDSVEDQEYADKERKYIAYLKNMQYASLGVAGLFWVVGVVDAFNNIDTYKTAYQYEPNEKYLAGSTNWRVSLSGAQEAPLGLSLNLRFK